MATSQCTGINLPRLSPQRLLEFQIPLPPLPEQQHIAAVLDAADALRHKRRAALAKLDTLLQSLFPDLFGDPMTNPKGWEEIELASLAHIVSGVTKGQRFGGKETAIVPYMQVANVQDGRLVLDEVKTIEALISDVEKYQLFPGDLLLTEGGDPDKLGRGAVWRGEIVNCIHQNHIFRVRLVTDKVIPEYLIALIGSQRGKRYFLQAAKQTTGIATINKRQLSQFPALLPPKELQIQFKFAGITIERARACHLALLQKTDELFFSIQQRAFRGEL